MQPENARSNNVELVCDGDKLKSREFKALWSKINAKSVYVVDFDTDELVNSMQLRLVEEARFTVPESISKPYPAGMWLTVMSH